MGLSPKVWGRQGWQFIHYIALNYPQKPTQEDKDNYYQFFESLQKTIPCPICGQHYSENFRKHPIKLNSRKELFNWSVDMHNFVNEANGKKKLTYDEALFELNNRNSKSYIYKGIGLSFGVIALISFMTYKISKK